jgi:hypothetical protein
LWTRRSTGAWSAPSCTWRRRGRTSSFLCVYAFVFRRRRGLHIGRPSRGSSGIFDTLLSLVFGTRLSLPFRFLVFQMPTLRGVDRKLTLGTCQFLGSSLVSWSSHKQSSVA